jgi:hypothetical protein
MKELKHKAQISSRSKHAVNIKHHQTKLTVKELEQVLTAFLPIVVGIVDFAASLLHSHSAQHRKPKCVKRYSHLI